MLLYLLAFCKTFPICALPAWQGPGADARRHRALSLPRTLSPLALLTTRTPDLLVGFAASGGALVAPLAAVSLCRVTGFTPIVPGTPHPPSSGLTHGSALPGAGRAVW